MDQVEVETAERREQLRFPNRSDCAGPTTVMIIAYPVWNSFADCPSEKCSATAAYHLFPKGMLMLGFSHKCGALTLEQFLCGFKCLTADDCLMRIFHIVLGSFAVVALFHRWKCIRRIFLLEQCISNVLFVDQNSFDGILKCTGVVQKITSLPIQTWGYSVVDGIISGRSLALYP